MTRVSTIQNGDRRGRSTLDPPRRWFARRGPGSGLLGLPEDLGDIVDLGEELVGDRLVERPLGAAGTRELRRLVEELVQVRVLLEVRRLEVVRPQHPEVMLD